MNSCMNCVNLEREETAADEHLQLLPDYNVLLPWRHDLQLLPSLGGNSYHLQLPVNLACSFCRLWCEIDRKLGRSLGARLGAAWYHFLLTCQ